MAKKKAAKVQRPKDYKFFSQKAKREFDEKNGLWKPKKEKLSNLDIRHAVDRRIASSVEGGLPPDFVVSVNENWRGTGNFGRMAQIVGTTAEQIIGPPRKWARDPETGHRLKRSKDEVLIMRAAIAHAMLLGWSEPEIREHFDMDQGLIRREMARVRDGWREHSAATYDELRAVELARLDNIAATAWAAFGRSQLDAVTVTEHDVDSDEEGAPLTKKSKKSTGQSGDPHFLEIAKACVADRCKILGLYAPKKHQVSVQQDHTINLDNCTREELDALAKIAARQLQRQAAETGHDRPQLQFDPAVSRQEDLQGGQSVSADCALVAAPANSRPGGLDMVLGEVLEAEFEECGDWEA